LGGAAAVSITDFSCAENFPFCYNKKSHKQDGQGNFLKNFLKTGRILRKKVMKLSRVLEDLWIYS
jgi:hypothetical protein